MSVSFEHIPIVKWIPRLLDKTRKENSSLLWPLKGIFGFLRWQPFTFRGLLSLSLAVLILEIYAIEHSDLVASIISAGIIILNSIAIIIGLYHRLQLPRALETKLFFENDPLLLVSRHDVNAGITLYNLRLWPFVSLEVKLIFSKPKVESVLHKLSGYFRKQDKVRLLDTLVFPHRGVWFVSGLSFRLQDAWGLTSFSWRQTINQKIEISAKNLSVKPLPVVAASSCAGDEIHHSDQRTGDLFDIKPYDPSDGISRILWKTYARSRELVVRRPEHASIPEGEVAVYMVANRLDDYVAGVTQYYLEQLEERSVQVLFGTDLSFDKDAESDLQAISTPNGQIYSSQLSEIKSMINQSAWSNNSGTGKGLEQYLEALSSANKSIEKIMVFLPKNSTKETFDRIINTAESWQIALAVTIVPAPETLTSPEMGKRDSSVLQFTSLPAYLLSKLKRNKTDRHLRDTTLTQLSKSLMAHNHQLLICEY